MTPQEQLTDYQRGYNDGIHAENERGNPEIFRLRKVIDGMEIQMEIDRQEIERLKKVIIEISELNCPGVTNLVMIGTKWQIT